MRNHYLIPFWTIFSVVLTVVGLLIWLSVVKSRDNQRIEMGGVAVQWMMEQYLDRALQKTVFHMIRYEKREAKKGMDVRLRMAQKAFLENAPLLTHHLFRFARGREVIRQLHKELSDKSNFEDVELFLLPDVLVHVSGNVLYTHLLRHACKVVVNESSLFDSYSNDESKQYLSALLLQTLSSSSSKTEAEAAVVLYE